MRLVILENILWRVHCGKDYLKECRRHHLKALMRRCEGTWSKSSHGNIKFTSTTQYFTSLRYSYQQSTQNTSRDMLIYIFCPVCFANIISSVMPHVYKYYMFVMAASLLKKTKQKQQLNHDRTNGGRDSKSTENHQIKHIRPALGWLVGWYTTWPQPHCMGTDGHSLTPSLPRRCREVVRVRFYVDLIVTDHLNEDWYGPTVWRTHELVTPKETSRIV